MSDQLSIQVSRALDDLGYNEEARQFRIDRYEEGNFVGGLCSHRLLVQRPLCGSKAEGTSRFSESDFDYLFIHSGVKATECQDIVQGASELTLFMEQNSAPPGYCKLQLLQAPLDNFWHTQFLRYNCYATPFNCLRPFLHSTAVVKMNSHLLPYETVTSGPSNKGSPPGGEEMDNVPAIRCAPMPHSLLKWIRRHHNQTEWPGRQLMAKIATSDIYLVPVGMHGTDQRYLQWRLAFDIPEKLLIQNFTDAQNKVYILLKMIKKEIIQPQCPESITSYIVKTLMLWAAEQIPARLWTNSKLIDLLLNVLYNLYICVQSGICPMYFIPERNILHGRVTRTTQTIICDILSSLLSDGISCILRLTTIQEKLTQYLFVPLAFRRLNGDDAEKISIVLNTAMRVNACGFIITGRSTLLCCQKIPYLELLTDLVSVPASTRSEREKLVKYVLSQTFSQFALQQCADTTGETGSNIHKYATVRRCLKIIHGSCHTDVLCGRMRLAQMFHMLGQYKAAKGVLATGVDRIRYYMSKLSARGILQNPVCNQRLEYLCRNECLSTFLVLKSFCLPEIQYDHMMGPCLPKALRYEVFKSCEDTSPCRIDAETLLYYLQYLCYKQLGERIKANVALTNLVWCAMRWESNIEYRKVALNILGHCLLKKRLYANAARVLAKSVMLSNKYSHLGWSYGFKTNAAMWHIAMLLNKHARHMGV